MGNKLIVIGACPAGLSCGYELTRAGITTEIYESTPFVGGMARSFEIWGQKVDLGPHRFFSKEKIVNDFFFSLIDDDYTLVNRQTRIYYRNRFFNYPLKLSNVLRNLPFTTIIQILLDYFHAMIFPNKNPQNLEEWLTNRFGRKLYEIFFKYYSEKLWGIPCSKIDTDWAVQRIKSFSLWEALLNSIFGNRGNKHKTLLDQFAYPNNGSGTIYERAADYIEQYGGKIHLQNPVRRVVQDISGKVEGVELECGEIIQADYVVSTMPLTILAGNLSNIPENVFNAVKKLYFRNTILAYLEVDSPDVFSDNWIYINSPEVTHGRITNFRNWTRDLYRDKKTTILCIEFWAFDKDPTWNYNDESVGELAKREIQKTGLIPLGASIINTFILRIPNCYPVYETGYREHVNMIENYLKTIENLYPVGRYGAFKYNNQDHSILMGILAAQKITRGLDTDLWKINSDKEYQEEVKIKNVFKSDKN